MLDLILSITALIFFILLLMIMMTVICIYVAIRRGEDLDSDEIRDKYVEITTITSVILGLIVFIIHN